MHVQVEEQANITRSHVGKVGCLSNHRNVVFWPRTFESVFEEWVGALSWCSCHVRAAHRSGILLVKSSVRTECTEPVFIPTSSASSRTVTRRYCVTKVRTWSMSSSVRFVEGIPDRASISTDVRPYMDMLHHSLICVMPMASSPKTRRIFRMVPTWLSPSFWQNFMQYRSSSRSVIFAENSNAMCAVYTLLLTRCLHATEALCRPEKIHVCAWGSPPPPYHSTPPMLH